MTVDDNTTIDNFNSVVDDEIPTIKAMIDAKINDNMRYINEQEVLFVRECMRDYMPWWLSKFVDRCLGTRLQNFAGKLMSTLGYEYEVVRRVGGSGIGECQFYTLIFRHRGKIINARELMINAVTVGS